MTQQQHKALENTCTLAISYPGCTRFLSIETLQLRVRRVKLLVPVKKRPDVQLDEGSFGSMGIR